MLTVAGPRGTAVLGLLAVLVALMPFFADTYMLQLASTGLVTAAFALSLNLPVGGAGMVSLAHAAVIAAIRADGIATVVVDKTVAAILSVVDRSAVLIKGRTVFDGAPAALRADEELMRRCLGV